MLKARPKLVNSQPLQCLEKRNLMMKETLLSQFESLQEKLENLEAASPTEETRLCAREALQVAESLRQDCEIGLDELAEQIQEAQQAKHKFTSHVTHELRLPLTSIRGYTDLLRQGITGPVTDQQLNFLNVIKNNVERMSALISDLSDVNYLESGRMKLNQKLIFLDEYIEEALNSFKSKLVEKEQTLQVNIPEQSRPIYADPNRLVQIVSTLVSNAHKYTPQGGKITLRAVEASGKVRVEISDTGIGISPTDQEQIFTQFFRSEHEGVREHPGWGLALYLAKKLVEAMGGEMGFESTLDQGSTFWFTLPTQPPAGTPAP
jgi:signal transduction histidine kinase